MMNMICLVAVSCLIVESRVSPSSSRVISSPDKVYVPQGGGGIIREVSSVTWDGLYCACFLKNATNDFTGLVFGEALRHVNITPEEERFLMS